LKNNEIMKSSGKWILYGGYAVMAGVFFLYLLFPEDALKEYAQKRVAQVQPALSVAIEKIRPSLPPGLRFQTVSVRHAGDSLVDIERIRVSPEVRTLFSENRSYVFRMSAYGGGIRGRFREYPGNNDTRISGNARIQEIDIGRVSFLRTLSDISIGGKLNGNILLQQDDTEGVDINARLEIAEATVELNVPFMPLKTLSFKRVEADFKMRSRTLILRQMAATGPQLDGRISGSIFLRDDIRQSVLNLTGKIKPHHLLLAGIGKGVSSFFFSATKDKPGGIAFKINGTLANPRLSFEPS